MSLDAAIARAAALLRDADALLIGAGAGIGVDAGLPDFRGDHGFWRAYPPLAKLGIRFVEMANPRHFAANPELAWGFYGHRLALYRNTVPHEGFAILRELGARLRHGAFVFTSNVDGQFQRAGFDPARLVECHGSIHHLQCTRPCSDAIWPADTVRPVIDPATCRMAPPLPTCPHCGALARPNILMFGDGAWIDTRSEAQYARLERWAAKCAGWWSWNWARAATSRRCGACANPKERRSSASIRASRTWRRCTASASRPGRWTHCGGCATPFRRLRSDELSGNSCRSSWLLPVRKYSINHHKNALKH